MHAPSHGTASVACLLPCRVCYCDLHAVQVRRGAALFNQVTYISAMRSSARPLLRR